MYKGLVDGSLHAIKIEDLHQEDEEQVNLIVELSMLNSYPHPNLVKFYGAGWVPRAGTDEKVGIIECFHGPEKTPDEFRLL